VLSRGAKPRDRSLTSEQANQRPWCSGNPSACHAEDASSILAGRSAGWSSGLARQAHNLEVDGSNPSPATFSGLWKNLANVHGDVACGREPRDRQFKSDHPDSAIPQTFRCGQTVRQPPVKRMSAGSIPATGAFPTVRPNSARASTEAQGDGLLTESALRKGKPSGDGSRLESGRALTMPCEFDSRSFRCNKKMCHWPIGKGASLPSWTGGFNSHMALSMNPIRGSANGRLPDFESGDRGSNPLPRACEARDNIALSFALPDPG
jgi:hypothetical protein